MSVPKNSQAGSSSDAPLRTGRLILRRWTDDDLPAFAAMNDDAEVMRFLPARLTRAESDAFAGRIQNCFERYGFGLWAVEVIEGPKFIGFVGLNVPQYAAHFTPCVEIGWRLAREHWRQGLAPEAARAALAYGFDRVGLDEIVAMTVPHNLPSRRVMEKIGMTRDPSDDFGHPRVPPDHELHRHVLYRISKPRLLDP